MHIVCLFFLFVIFKVPYGFWLAVKDTLTLAWLLYWEEKIGCSEWPPCAYSGAYRRRGIDEIFYIKKLSTPVVKGSSGDESLSILDSIYIGWWVKICLVP